VWSTPASVAEVIACYRQLQTMTAMQRLQPIDTTTERLLQGEEQPFSESDEPTA